MLAVCRLAVHSGLVTSNSLQSNQGNGTFLTPKTRQVKSACNTPFWIDIT